ncbi:MAG: MoaD/ThiS family protein [Myxococcaceae bacterium]
MATVSFTGQLQRHVDCPARSVSGGTLREVMEAYFKEQPGVRGYVFDEQDTVRRHIVIFIDGVQARDRKSCSDAVGPSSEIYVMQALSGG